MLIGHSVSDAGGTVMAADIAVCDALERPRRDIVGASYLDLTHPADRRRNAVMIDRLAVEAPPIGFLKRYLTPDGGIVEIELTVSRLSTGSGGGNLVGTLYRIAPADRRYTPAKLWQAAKRLAELTELRRDLLGSDLFADYPLSLLLRLYIDEAEGRGSDLATLAAAIELQPDATLRWLRALEQKELIELFGGTLAQLTGIGAQRLAKLLSANVEQAPPISPGRVSSPFGVR